MTSDLSAYYESESYYDEIQENKKKISSPKELKKYKSVPKIFNFV